MTMPAGWKKPTDQVAAGSEQTLWRNEITKGIINKKVSEVQTITNYRLMRNDSGVLLKDINDIVVMNQHRASQSQYTGTSTGRYARIGFGSSRSNSKTIGDLVFIYKGRPYITFTQISDPQSVARLAKAARKQILAAIKAAEKIEARSKKKQEKRPTRERNAIICPRCNNTNPAESKYCNNCSFRLSETTNLAHSIMASTAPHPTTETKFLICELPSYGIRIQYPSNWLKVEHGLKSPLIIAFKSPKDSASDPYLEPVGISLTPVPSNTALEHYVQLNINHSRNKHSDFLVIESTPTIIADMPAHRLVYTESGYKTLFIVIIKESTAYNIVYRAEQTKYSIYLSTVEKMIDSFEFIK